MAVLPGSSLTITEEEVQLSSETMQLEMAYITALHNIDTTIRDEERRGFHVRSILAEHDRDSLRWQCQSAKTELESAERSRSAVDTQLSNAADNIDRLEELLRTRQRENESLRAEIKALQGASGDSAKIQAEKAALAREVAALKPEIAQLRSQNATQQSAVSEKLTLERHVNSLEVELQNTKRSLERSRLKESQSSNGNDDEEEEEEENSRIERLNNQYLREKEERQRIEKEASDGARHRQSLESKINALEGKLESATEQLTIAQDRLRHQVESRTSGQRVHFAGDGGGRSQKPVQFDPGMVIATPGGAKTSNKTQKSLALPGDKSAFSITPFLNRTSGNSASQNVSFGDEDESSSDSSEHKARTRGKATGSTVRRRGKPSGHRKTAPETNLSSSSHQATNGRKSPSDSSRSIKQGGNKGNKSAAYPSPSENHGSPTAKKKEAPGKHAPVGKRDRTLFDEDEDLRDQRQNRKAPAIQSLDGQGRRTEGLRPVRRLGATATLDAGSGFSPLKRKGRATYI